MYVETILFRDEARINITSFISYELTFNGVNASLLSNFTTTKLDITAIDFFKNRTTQTLYATFVGN